jgi:hypothetical protein
MKKNLLLAVTLFTCVALAAQNVKIRSGIHEDMPPDRYVSENLTNTGTLLNSPSIPEKPDVKAEAGGIVSVIAIGESANAYGLYNKARTYLWADDNVNSVVFTHRMTANPGSGYVAYDYSSDGGWTWINNIQVFDPTQGGENARYPQGLIYNPSGNTNPDNAYYSYFTPTLDQSNPGTNWGGYVGGTHKLDQLSPPTQNYWGSDPPYRHNVPTAMTINPNSGDIFVMEPALLEGLGNQYTDTLVITKGTFIESTENFEYTQSLFYAPPYTPGRASAAEKIAFAPDGMTGYMVLVWDNGDDPFAAGWAYYPVLYKTTDGGETWSGPITVVLAGPDGFDAIKYYLTDEQWESLWTEPDQVHRDSVLYTSAYDIGLSVDHFGNPHLNVTIGVSGTSGPYTIIAHSGYGAQFHIFSLDQGDTWLAHFIRYNKTFRGEFGEISEDVRPTLSRTMDGQYLFFSWIDTDFEGVTDNIMPDLYCVGYDVESMSYTDEYNVTYLSEGWLEAYMGVASIYAFTNVDGSFTVPFVYQSITGSDPLQPVTFKYIPDFNIDPNLFYLLGSENVKNENLAFGVSQNYPNPVNGITQFTVDLNRQSDITIEVYNIMGQNVQTSIKGKLNEGSHRIQLDMNGFSPGLYFYTVKAVDQSITRKMIVQ